MECQYTSLAECERKHNIQYRYNGFFFTALTVIIIGIGWSLAATRGATDVSTRLQVHEAAQKGQLELIDQKLEHIKDQLAQRTVVP